MTIQRYKQKLSRFSLFPLFFSEKNLAVVECCMIYLSFMSISPLQLSHNFCLWFTCKHIWYPWLNFKFHMFKSILMDKTYISWIISYILDRKHKYKYYRCFYLKDSSLWTWPVLLMLLVLLVPWFLFFALSHHNFSAWQPRSRL